MRTAFLDRMHCPTDSGSRIVDKGKRGENDGEKGTLSSTRGQTTDSTGTIFSLVRNGTKSREAR